MQPEVIAIFGRRGSGKTTRARQLVDNRSRAIVFDPLGEWATFRGFKRCSTIGACLMPLVSGNPAKLAYVPPASNHIKAAHCLAKLVWQVQEIATRLGEITLVIDEANLSYPVSRLPADAWGLPTCLLQGRHRQIAMIAISQRPALVSLDLRANAHKSFWFAIAGQDRKAAMQTLPAADVQRLASLSDHQYLLEDRGRVQVGQNAGLSARRARLKPPAKSITRNRKSRSAKAAC